MSSIFEELAALDRPVVDMKLKIGKRQLDVQVQRPNALEVDAIEAYYNDEYARLIVDKTDDKHDESGKLLECDLNQMRKIYSVRPRADLVSQLLQTRVGEIERLAVSKLDFDPSAEVRYMLELNNEDREERFALRKAELEAARVAAEAEIRAEYDSRSTEELAEQCSQINVNLKTIAEAQRSRESVYLYFVVKRDGKRVFPSADAIRAEFQPMTIASLVKQAEEAFATQSAADLPFVSPGDSEPGGPPTSPQSSVAVTKVGGKRTKTTRGNSKRSSTPAAEIT